MVLIVWGPTLRLGFPELDQGHRRLVGLFNELGEAVRDGLGAQVAGALVDDLAAHAGHQFRFEEQLLREYRVEFAERHLAEHEALAAELRALGPKASAGGVALPELMELMRSWLVDHVLKTDRALVAYLRARGVMAAA